MRTVNKKLKLSNPTTVSSTTQVKSVYSCLRLTHHFNLSYLGTKTDANIGTYKNVNLNHGMGISFKT